ncbi:unnamed protein product [Vitrella brassicaformis CCMP3155]|uniref:Uncharacterized protein n=2 Tax=Vitrella brassicaformis TaxID=1169539 RepID=A0A0G4FH24_VITBC|nr:unnamed protein product [Vitrella brassicaformis CCMP3155]|eukprot:CEM12717.1 unnamed protein product [Vitrella brassicaformis CCMP3155]
MQQQNGIHEENKPTALPLSQITFDLGAPLGCVSYSREGKNLCVGSTEGVRIVDVDNSRLLPIGHDKHSDSQLGGATLAVAYSADNTTICYAAQDRSLRSVDVTQRPLRETSRVYLDKHTLTITPASSNKWISATGMNGQLAVWSRESGALLNPPCTLHDGPVMDACPLSESEAPTLLATVGETSGMVIVDLLKSTAVMTIPGRFHRVASNGKIVIACSRQGDVRMMSARNPALYEDFLIPAEALQPPNAAGKREGAMQPVIRSLAVSETLVAIGMKTGEVVLLGAASPAHVQSAHEPETEGEEVVSLPPDASSGTPMSDRVGDLSKTLDSEQGGHVDMRLKLNLVAVLKGHSKDVTGITFSGDGCRVASVSLDGKLRVWDCSPLLSSLAAPSSASPALPECPAGSPSFMFREPLVQRRRASSGAAGGGQREPRAQSRQGASRRTSSHSRPRGSSPPRSVSPSGGSRKAPPPGRDRSPTSAQRQSPKSPSLKGPPLPQEQPGDKMWHDRFHLTSSKGNDGRPVCMRDYFGHPKAAPPEHRTLPSEVSPSDRPTTTHVLTRSGSVQPAHFAKTSQGLLSPPGSPVHGQPVPKLGRSNTAGQLHHEIQRGTLSSSGSHFLQHISTVADDRPTAPFGTPAEYWKRYQGSDDMSSRMQIRRLASGLTSEETVREYLTMNHSRHRPGGNMKDKTGHIVKWDNRFHLHPSRDNAHVNPRLRQYFERETPLKNRYTHWKQSC